MIEPSTFRILHNGHVLGAGFLVAKDIAVTCAHVIEGADDSIQVQFSGQDEILQAQVISNYYRDPRSGDIAFLLLKGVPKDISSLQLGSADHSTSGSSFQAFGYPIMGQIEGVHARGVMLGIVTENDQRLLQLRSKELDLGYSGAPVWDEKRGVVVGMVYSVYEPNASGKSGDTAFAIPSESLWQVFPDICPTGTCPYIGLEAFTAETARFFFGREELIEKLLDNLREGCRFLAVFGPSGSGKSSIVRAGLLSELKKGKVVDSQKWIQIIIRPIDNPFEQMKASGFDLIEIDEYFRSQSNNNRVILFIDQFEELFTLCPEDMQNRFIRDITNILENSSFILIIAMRDDFYSTFHSGASLLAESKYLKTENVPGNLKHNELVAIINRPADAVSLLLEEGLTDLILKDVTTNGEANSTILPLLEFALTQLWEKRRESLLTRESYQSIGGVTGSLARWADNAYNDLPKADQPKAEKLLTSLVHLGDDTQGLPDTGKRRALAEFDEPTRNLIKYFTDHRLLVTSDATVELVHDSLVRVWGRLQSWIKNDRDNLRLIEGVRDAARQWEAGGMDESLLIHRERRLADAISLNNKSHYVLTTKEQAYINACLRIKIREENKRRKEERNKRWLFLSIAGVISGVVILALLAISVVTTLAITGQLNYLIYRPLPMEWVTVPSGEFLMGSNPQQDPYANPNEFPQHKVYLDTYKIGMYEVTNSQYGRCVQSGTCLPPSSSFYQDHTYSNYPVTNIDWQSAVTFCKWVGGRLPTEAEWEKAARGANGRLFSWGNINYGCAVANFSVGDSNGKAPGCAGSTAPVGSYPRGVSPYGAQDMAGNVWEWTADWFSESYYTNSSLNNPKGPENGDQRVLRGGSWDNGLADIRAAKRYIAFPDLKNDQTGFRCAQLP